MSAPEQTSVDVEAHSQAQSGGHRPNTALLLATVLAVAAVAISLVVVLSRPGDDVASVGQPRLAASTANADLSSRRIMKRLDSAVRADDRAAFLSLWSDNPRARRQGSMLFHNLDALNARVAFDLALTTPHLDANGLSVPADEGWDAKATVHWQLGGVDRSAAAATVVIQLVTFDDAVRIAGISQPRSDRRPIWMLGRLTVVRKPDMVVAATNPAVARQVAILAQTAEDDVRQVEPSWRGGITAYVPATQADFDAMVAASPGQYDNIAAVTSSVDGSSAATSPQMIAINPAVFSELAPDGRRVVVTHEATHLATGAAGSTAPNWLIEGYADYVAIRAAGVPFAAVAASTLDEVSANGMPTELPADADFSDREADRQQAAYTLSWLAVRMLAQRFGEDRVTAIYNAVLEHPNELERLLETHLDLSLDGLTHAWQASVGRLADAT